jgi:hypothetical protein
MTSMNGHGLAAHGGDGSHEGHDSDAHDPASVAIMAYKPPNFAYNIRQIARDSLAVLREGNQTTIVTVSLYRQLADHRRIWYHGYTYSATIESIRTSA